MMQLPAFGVALSIAFCLLCNPTIAATAKPLQTDVLTVKGGTLQIHFESTFSVPQKTTLTQWLSMNAQTITTLYGEFPVKNAQVYVYAQPDANEPVPWADVWKNKGYRVNFYVNPHYPLQAFLSDWTASHELSHLLHPYPGQDNAWFGEGLASYYQNILRVRQGVLSEQEAWQKLYDGFQRGERNALRDGLTLQQASETMRKKHSFMHVYWGGAAYFLSVDIRLRLATNGKESLDTAWYKFKNCCLDYNRDWPLNQLIEKLGVLTGTQIFSEEYTRMVLAPTFPDYRQLLKSLDITVDANQINPNAKGAGAALRRQLVTKKSLTNLSGLH